jgi:copper chaperone
MVMTKTISLKKMNSADDAERISKILHDVWGIRKVEIQLDKREATISFDENAASIHDFEQAITDSGYYEVTNEKGPIKQ